MMKKETRGRKTILNPRLTRDICVRLSRGASIQSACVLCNVGERTFFDWQERGKAGEEPYATFFSAATRAREQHKARLIAVVMEAAHKDARHAEWLLERQFPREFAPIDRRPIPREEPPATIPVTFVATLPSGAKVDLDEVWKVVRAQREAAQAREPIKNEPTAENEPMTHRYNHLTRCVEPIEPIDNREHED
ncbi:MAG TPA: hypothetical protein VFU09_08820 [Candidatus Udaeobacter sp.]|nr:hypothetical protein [Candidatus Udaeobacter sp.]